MKVPFAVLALALGALALLAPTKGARADQQVWGDMYQFQCVPELDVMEVRAVTIFGEKAQRVAERPDKHLQDKHGFFSPRWYYSTESEFVRKPVRFRCALSAGLVELVILPEPLIVFAMSGGEWWKPVGEHIESISVSFRIAGRLILDDVPFHRCEDDAYISRFFYNATESKFHLRGSFGALPGQVKTPSDADATQQSTVSFSIEPDNISIPETAMPPVLAWTMRLGPLAAENVYNPVLTSDPDPDRDGYACQYLGVDYLEPHRPAIRPNAPNAPVERRFPG